MFVGQDLDVRDNLDSTDWCQDKTGTSRVERPVLWKGEEKESSAGWAGGFCLFVLLVGAREFKRKIRNRKNSSRKWSED